MKGKHITPWHGDPQDVGAIDRMRTDKEINSNFFFFKGEQQAMRLLDILSLKFESETPGELSSRQKVELEKVETWDHKSAQRPAGYWVLPRSWS